MNWRTGKHVGNVMPHTHTHTPAQDHMIVKCANGANENHRLMRSIETGKHCYDYFLSFFLITFFVFASFIHSAHTRPSCDRRCDEANRPAHRFKASKKEVRIQYGDLAITHSALVRIYLRALGLRIMWFAEEMLFACTCADALLRNQTMCLFKKKRGLDKNAAIIKTKSWSEDETARATWTISKKIK